MTDAPDPQSAEPVPSHRIANGVVKLLTGQLARFSLQFLGTIWLARILDPTDYGLLAMVLVVVGLGEIFRDFGLSLAAVQARTLSRAEQSNLFWANSLIGVALALICIPCAPLVAGFFDEPRLVPVTMVLASVFVLNGMATQYRANLNRELKFGGLALVDVGAQGIGLIAGVTAAYGGLGYWSLVIQQVTYAAAALVVASAITGWMPRRYDRTVSVRPFFSFGWPLVVTQLVGYASRNADTVVIGHAFGASPLGLYNRAFQLLMLPLNQLNAPSTQVALPVLSRLRDDRERFDRHLLRGQGTMALLICALMLFSGAHSEAIVSLLFGEKWLDSAPLFSILALAGCAQAVGYATYWCFLALGATRSNMVYSILSRTVMIGIVVAGATWGVTGVAAGYTIAVTLSWPFGLWWISRFHGCPGLRMFVNGLKAFLIGVLVVAPTLLAERLVDDGHPLVVLGVAAALLLLSIGVSCLIPAIRRDYAALVDFMSGAIAGRRKVSPP